jgi:hypothetical protein
MARRRKPKPPPRPKERTPPKPLRPEHQFPPPYARLLTLGADYDETVYDAMAEELRAGNTRAAAEQLLKMALDETYYDYWSEDNPDDPRCWTRVHAVRVLERLGEAAHIAIEPLLPLLNEEDDYLREEMPMFYGAMGAAAIEPLAKLLNDPKEEEFARAGAGDSLAEIAEAHPETHAQVVAILERVVATDADDPTLVGFLISNLLDIGAKESLPIIRQAFEEERVDEFIVQMPDVEEHFGLPVTSPRKALWPFGNEDKEDEDDFEAEDREEAELPGLPGYGPPEEVPQPYVAPPKVGRNDPCPCGSGKKYKKCCGA